MTGDSGGFDPLSFLEAAVAIPSHPDAGVAEMRAFLVETLEDHGVEATVDEAGNVLATRDGKTDGEDASAERGTHYVLNTHIDTVSPHVSLEIGDGEIRGRGSCDAKGQVAALLAAFLEAETTNRVTLAITPDEELLSTGAHALVSHPDSPVQDADAVIVGEPTGLDVCTAAKGRFEGTIELSGANAHAAEPQSGVNAVAALEQVLGALETFDDREDAPPAHPDLGPAALTPTVVQGGEATNQVPDRVRLTIDRRSVPPETAEEFERALVAHLEAAVPAEVGVDFAFTERPTPFLEAWATDTEAPIVDALAARGSGEVRPFTAATEASYFAAHAPTVVFGPGVLADEDGAVAHSPREYVETAAVRMGAEAVKRVLELS
ncbi:M20/M25/M40 family metallo-hydrolase [Natronosalvus halobius]|uniref:M20/M25/M40 family metallo-hydrolase n=1 Tax=Natronosalvus halobius TaxID=2953746 RepID=UPI0020A2302A|nr:M20/M25/M40 family metallo-hydrolase [Natronosalvus halobius]USZ71343.1 M20/M25/M40 family metallo-hydrolase [Natronosalvus halobius]